MVYRYLDPSRDWDAYCADHPEPPCFDDINEQYYMSECCTHPVEVAGKGYRCDCCGKFCDIDQEASVRAFIAECEADAVEPDDYY